MAAFGILTYYITYVEPHSSVGSVEDLRTGGRWFDPQHDQYSFRHYDRIHSSLAAVYCFDKKNVGKQLVAWKKYCAEYWLTNKKKKPPGKHG